MACNLFIHTIGIGHNDSFHQSEGRRLKKWEGYLSARCGHSSPKGTHRLFLQRRREWTASRTLDQRDWHLQMKETNLVTDIPHKNY